MTVQFLLAIFSGIVVLNSVFFGVSLLIDKKGLIKNRLLGMILLGIAFRTGKSILLLLLPQVPETIPAFGLVGMGAIGPLLYLYAHHMTGAPWIKINLLHFLFSVGMGASLFFVPEEVVFWLYLTAALQMAGYLSVTVSHVYKHRTTFDSDLFGWLKFLSTSIFIVWGVYTAQLFFQEAVAYLLGTVTASVALFALLFRAMQSHRIFIRTKPIKQTEDGRALADRVLQLMEEEKYFKDSELTLPRLARQLNVKPYLLSGVLNTYHKKSFPEFVNEYRIKEAQKLLTSDKYQVYSIEAVAYDCGFNTPSAFYTYFKKLTHLTPAEYRDRSMAHLANR